MEYTKQYALSAFRLVQDFVTEHTVKLGPVADCEGRKLLDEAVGNLEDHGLAQSSSRLEGDGKRSLQTALEAELRKEHMKPIAEYSRARLRGDPEIDALTRGTAHLKGAKLVGAARAMAKAAQPHADALTRNAFPADALDQLSKAADNLEASLDGRGKLKVRRAGAREGIDDETKRGYEAVAMLNAAIERGFAKDKPFLAAWRTAKKVAMKPGYPRGKGPAAPGSEPAKPVGTGS